MSVDPNKGYRPDIDGLRAVAVAVVVLFHVGVSGLGGGYVGVDVFFVISGFLITSIISSEMRRGTFSLLGFYERRVRRIFPALFACLAVVGIASLAILLPDELMDFGKSLVATALFSSNLLFWSQDGYFDTASEDKPLLHTWSLSVEEQFYIAFPLFLALLYRWFPGRVKAAVLVVALLSFVVNLVTTALDPTSAFYLPHARAWELMLGSLLALGVVPSPAGRRVAELEAAIGLFLIVGSVLLLTADSKFPGWMALPPTLGAAMIIHANGRARTSVGTLLAWKPFVGLGLVSYSLYLWHWPLIVLYLKVTGRELQPLDQLGLVAASLGAAILSWRFVETPLRLRQVLATRSSLLRWGVGTMAAATAIGVALVVVQGLPQRLPGQVLDVARVAEEKQAQQAAFRCADISLPVAGARLCHIRQSAPGDSSPPVLLWGDSHAMALRSAVSGWLEDSGKHGLIASFAGCPPLMDFDRVNFSRPCGEMSRAVLEYIEQQGIRQVLIVASWRGVLLEKDSTYRGTISNDRESRQHNVVAALAATLQELSRLGVQVAFVEPVPGARRAVPEALARSLWMQSGSQVEFTREEYRSMAAPLQRVLESMQPRPVALVLRPADLLCGTGHCVVAEANQPYYFDSNHPSHLLNERIKAAFAEQMMQFLSGSVARTASYPAHPVPDEGGG